MQIQSSLTFLPKPNILMELPMLDSELGYKIVLNPGYDFDLGYRNKCEFFHYPGFKFVTCAGCA